MKKTVLIPFLLVLLACGHQEPQMQQIRIGTRQAPDSLHPYVTTSLEGEVISARLFPQLFRECPRFEKGIPVLEPVLVASHVFSEDLLSLDVTLVEELTWSDGQPLTSSDIAYTLSVQKDPEVAWLGQSRKDHVIDVTVVSPTRFKVSFDRPSPFNLLDFNEGAILPRHYFEKIPVAEWQRAWGPEMVVYGPYKVAQVTEGDRLVLEGLDPTLPRLGFAFVRERETLYQLLLSNELDFAWPLPVDRIGDLEQKLHPVIYNAMGFAFLGLNPIRADAFPEEGFNDPEVLAKLQQSAPHPLFGDPRVRRALVFGINRRAHAQRFWQGVGTVPANPWQTGLEAYPTNHTAETFDREKAAALLDEAGWRLDGQVRKKEGLPFRFTTICNVSKGIREQYLLAVQQDLKVLGIDMQIDLQEARRYFDNCMNRQFDAMFGAYTISTRPDQYDVLHSSAMYNFTSFVEADETLTALRDAPSVAAMNQQRDAMEALFHEHMPFVMLYTRTMVAASVKSLRPKANYLDPLYGVEHWLEGEK